MFDNEEIEFMGSGVTEFYGIYSHLHIWFIPKYSIGTATMSPGPKESLP